ncbi:MAG TPA: GNAT family protein [Gaiellaceae bacterium]|nr:GNAT family protein [Gaiellaceae bacterium]
MPSAAELADGDLVLRPWSEEDARAVALTPASPEIGQYFGPAFRGAPEPDPEAPAFAIVAGGMPVGRIWCAAQKRPFEVGYFLRPEAWGRGLATRSLVLVRDFLLASGEHEVALCTHPENERSHRVAARAGFRLAGEIPEYARFGDGTTRALRFLFP